MTPPTPRRTPQHSRSADVPPPTTPSPSSARRGRPRRRGVSVAVMEALIAVVAEKGYAATSMDEVAERAGVSKASIYRRWPSKDALILDAHAAMLEEHDIPDSGSLEGDLFALSEHMADTMQEKRLPRMMQASVGEMLANAELAAAFRKHLMEPRLELVHRVFQRAIERGEAPPDLDWRSMAFALIGPNIMRVAFLGEPVDREANRRLAAMIARECALQVGD